MVALIANISLFAYGTDVANTTSTSGIRPIEMSDVAPGDEAVAAIPPTAVILTALALAAICHGTHKQYVVAPNAVEVEEMNFEMSQLD